MWKPFLYGAKCLLEIYKLLCKVANPLLEIYKLLCEVANPLLEIYKPLCEVANPVLEIYKPLCEVANPILEIYKPLCESTKLYSRLCRRLWTKKGAEINRLPFLYISDVFFYSARSVKRLKERICNSGSASFITSRTVFLPSITSSWFSRQTSFINLARRPFAMF